MSLRRFLLRRLRPLSSVLCPAILAVFSGCAREKVERVEWTVMGTVAAVQEKGRTGAGRGGVLDVVKATFSEVESLLNAHDPNSELSRLAALPDAEILARCNPLVRPCYAAAFRLRDETGRVFNPRYRGPGTLDLGAIAKGFAVDLAAERVKAAFGETGAVLVDLGGNLRSVGGTWSVGIVGGEGRSDVSELSLTDGEACATSGEYYRGHHIKDGRDGSSLSNTVYSVTVVHPASAMLADGLSTVMFILGRERGEAFLREHHPEARAEWIR